ncbi:hypothetical protein FOA52_002599 [Chlamydomonas sp. UWO 241]|nr:hypothetical protein FOA52_002599 [Chlamydomonas sp. UWO 241]
MGEQSELPQQEGWLLKLTGNDDFVVRRYVQLRSLGSLRSAHDEAGSRGLKRWYLDSHCSLVPADASAMVAQRKKVRASGTWSITTRVKGTGESVDLYVIKIKWPSSWATKGYTTLTLGCESADDAARWHASLAASIESMRERKQRRGSKFGRISAGAALLQQPPACDGQLDGSTRPCVARVSVARSENGLDAGVPAVGGCSPLAPSGGGCGGVSGGGNPAMARFASGALGSLASSEHGGDGGGGAGGGPADDFHDAVDDSSSSDDDDGAGGEAGGGVGGKGGDSGRHKWANASQRWVPYKQANGVAIYHLDEPSAGGPGGEYMVSASIRGSPAEVLSVLMQGSANTTILGPASIVEMLDCALPRGPNGALDTSASCKELIRLVLEAPGWAGWLCAPREMLVERMLKTEEGMYVVLFHSIDPDTHGSREAPGSSARAAPAIVHTRKLRSMYSKPVRGEVHGTYTLAPLEGHQLSSSPETLITVIIKLDLRGACGDRSWVRPLADAAGWTDAFLDRILMSVILVRDEVEHSRFKLKPLSLLTSGTGPAALADEDKVDPSLVTVSLVRRGRMGSALLMADRAESIAPSASDGGAAHATPSKTDAHDGGDHKGAVTQNLAATSLTANLAATSLPAVSERGEEDDSDTLLDLQHIQDLCTCDKKYWESIHAPGKASPFRVRGPTYLKDRKKIPAGLTAFTFGAMDVVTMPHVVNHIARYLPSIRLGRIPFAFIINLIIPGTPLLGIVATFLTDRHPDVMGPMPKHPMEEDHDWSGFDFVLHKFLNGTSATRNMMLKLIPHIADGSWVIKQSVGTMPVITGKALKTTYHTTKQYIEIDIDVSANQVAAYVTGLVRGATKNLVIDMGFVLEGTAPWELPECLLGCLRLNYLDIAKAKPLDISKEIPLKRAAIPPAPPPPATADISPSDPPTLSPFASGCGGSSHARGSSFSTHQFKPEMLPPGLARPSVSSQYTTGSL